MTTNLADGEAAVSVNEGSGTSSGTSVSILDSLRAPTHATASEPEILYYPPVRRRISGLNWVITKNLFTHLALRIIEGKVIVIA